MRCRSFLRVLCLGLLVAAMPALQILAADALTDPDGKPADMTKRNVSMTLRHLRNEFSVAG